MWILIYLCRTPLGEGKPNYLLAESISWLSTDKIWVSRFYDTKMEYLPQHWILSTGKSEEVWYRLEEKLLDFNVRDRVPSELRLLSGMMSLYCCIRMNT